MFLQDDSFSTHPKVLSIPRTKRFAAIGLWDMAGTWCARHLTDGAVPAFMLDEWGTGGKPLAKLLVTAGLWEETPEGYQFHDWHIWQTMKDDALAKRAANARTQWLTRHADVREAVRQRDRDRCRYCGQQVAWSDRRGASGATYRFVDLEGPSTSGNVVVACRGCTTLLDGGNTDLTLQPAPTTRVVTDPDSQDVPRYDLGGHNVVSDPLPVPSHSPTKPKEKNPPGGRKAPAPPEGLDLDVPEPPPSQAALNASHVVAAWVTAMNDNGVKPTTAQTGRVGRMARELLTAGNPADDVLAAATEAGRGGFEAIDRELAKAKGRPRLTTVPAANDRPIPGSRLWDQATTHHNPRESA